MALRWILCGKNDVAIACLEHLVSRGDEVWVIGTAGDSGQDGWQGSLVGAARRLGVRVEQPRRINDPATVERLASFGARALVSIQYDQILKGPLFRGIGCACLNLHYSLLPRHRGVYPVAWAILEGDETAGVTLHHMVEDIDAGDVIAQREIPVAPRTTARELYDGLADAAIALFRESHPFPDELLARRLPQDASRACYHAYGDLDYAQRSIDWKRSAEEVHRFVRMMIFPPLNLPETTLHGRGLGVTRIAPELGAPVSALPGTVVGVSGGGIDVAAGDRAVRITGLVSLDGSQGKDADPLRTLVVGDQLL